MVAARRPRLGAVCRAAGQARSARRRTGGRRVSLDRFIRIAAARARAERTPTVEITNSHRSHAQLFNRGGHRHLVIGAAPATPYGPAAGTAPLPVDDGWCGVTLCVDVLGRLTDPLNVLAELNRVLADDGHLYLVSPLVMSAVPASEPLRRAPLGMNYLLESSGFAMVDHRLVRDRTDYAVLARKTRSLANRSPRFGP